MAKGTDLSSLPIDEFYNVLGQRLDTSSEMMATAFELLNTASKRIDQLEQRVANLEQARRS